MYSIGIIAVAASLKNIMEIAPQMQEQCNVTFLTYTSNDNLVYIYQQNVNQFDALLFGGSYTYNTLLERVGSIPKPCAFFNIADRDYFRVIAQLAIQEPGVDFSRVFFDQPDQPVDFESVLGPQGASIVEEIDPSMPYGDYWNQGLNRYRELWKSGQADWIVSRFGSMEEQLQKEGIRYKLLLPSKESMLDTFYGLLLRLQEKAPRGGATGIGLLRPHSSSGRQLEDLALAAEQASRQMGGVFLVYRHGPNVELTVSAPTLWEATRQYTSSRLLPFLKKRLDFPFAIGWGCAEDVIAAHRGASRALKNALGQPASSAFLVTEDAYLIGPLAEEGTGTPIAVQRPQELMYRLPARYVNQLVEAFEGKKEVVLCAREMGEILNLTTRSAARILSQLADAGSAVTANKRGMSQRGRPVKYYRLDLEALS